MSFQDSRVNFVAGHSSPIMLEDYTALTATVIPGTGSATAQYTTSSREDIEMGYAHWIDWPLGWVNVPTTDGTILRVMALRLVSSADAVLEVMA